MSILPAFLVLTAWQTAPVPDRSGEASLLEALDYFGKLKAAELTANRYISEVRGGPTAREIWFDLTWGGKGQFRYSISDNWSDGMIVTGDGTTIMSDPLSPDRPVVLRKTSPLHNVPELAPNTQGSILLLLFDGPSVLPTLTNRDRPLTVKQSGDLYTWALHRSEGTGELTLRRSGNGWQPVRYRFQKPETGGRPWDPEETLDEVAHFSVGAKKDRRLFVIKPPEGMRVTDLRNSE